LPLALPARYTRPVQEAAYVHERIAMPDPAASSRLPLSPYGDKLGRYLRPQATA